jgi:hypothetical protein
MSRSGLTSILLTEALKEPGCPICSCCADHETRYLLALVRENVNHIETRVHLSHSLGFYQRHAWQALHLERDSLGMILGNSIIYESLVELVLVRVRQVRTEVATAQGQHAWLSSAFAWLLAHARSSPGKVSRLLTPTEVCRACELSAETARRHGAVLVEMLAEDTFRDLYRASDGVCLHHLMEIVNHVRPCVGLEHLLSQTEERLEELACHLAELDQEYRTWHLCDPIDGPASRSVGEAIAFMTGGVSTRP